MIVRFLIAFLLFVLCSSPSCGMQQLEKSDDITLYYFWGKECGLCRFLAPFIDEVEENYSDVSVERFEVSVDAENRAFFSRLNEAYGGELLGTPTVIVGDEMIAGYFTGHTKPRITQKLEECRAVGCVDPLDVLAAYESQSGGNESTAPASTIVEGPTSSTIRQGTGDSGDSLVEGSPPSTTTSPSVGKEIEDDEGHLCPVEGCPDPWEGEQTEGDGEDTAGRGTNLLTGAILFLVLIVGLAFLKKRGGD